MRRECDQINVKSGSRSDNCTQIAGIGDAVKVENESRLLQDAFDLSGVSRPFHHGQQALRAHRICQCLKELRLRLVNRGTPEIKMCQKVPARPRHVIGRDNDIFGKKSILEHGLDRANTFDHDFARFASAVTSEQPAQLFLYCLCQLHRCRIIAASVRRVKFFVLAAAPTSGFLNRMRILALILLLLFGSAGPCQAQTLLSGRIEVSLDSLAPLSLKRALSQSTREYRVGLALSGGGARGFAQIGVLSELENAGIEVDVIAGTSMGGIVGGLYALGMPPHDIEAATKEVDWAGFFSDRPQRSAQLLSRRAETEGELLTLRFEGIEPRIPTALSSGQKLLNILNSLTQIPAYFSKGDFANLDKPLAIVSTDIVSGTKVVFTSGSLVTAMRATIGVPLAFTPFEDGERLLMDGGLLDPIPTDEARRLGADFVLAVNTTSTLLHKEEITDAVDVANQTTTILSAPTQERLLEAADFVITPDLTGVKATDFTAVDAIIMAGREAAGRSLDALLIGLDSLGNAAPTYPVRQIEFSDAVPDSYRVLVLERLRPPSSSQGLELSRNAIESILLDIFQQGDVAGINYRLTDDTDRATLRIDLVPLPMISGVEFSGNEVFSDSQLCQILGLHRSEKISLKDLQALYDCIIDQYHEQGYDLAQITSAKLDRHTGILEVHLDEGRIVGIVVEGNRKTRGWAVTSYFPLKVDQLYNSAKADQGVRNIYASGLFENVSLQLSEKPGGVLIKILVKEKNFTFAKLGAHYHEEYHPESFLKLGYANIGGTGNELSLYATFSERRKHYEAQLRADRIFRSMVTYSIGVYYHNDKIGEFRDDRVIGLRTDKRWGARIGIGQQLARFGLFDVTALYQHVRYSLAGEETSTERQVASLQFNLRYDTKDRFDFPSNGRASQVSFEIASDVLGAEEVYQKFEGYIEVYQPLGKSLNLHPKALMGVSKDGLPIFDQFYLGGTRSFIGYRTDQLRGDKYLLSNLELRLGPIFNFYLSARYDMGEVFGRFEELRFNQLRHAFGFMLALDTPLGPFSFAYGRAEGKYDNLYLNLGYDF